MSDLKVNFLMIKWITMITHPSILVSHERRLIGGVVAMMPVMILMFQHFGSRKNLSAVDNLQSLLIRIDHRWFISIL